MKRYRLGIAGALVVLLGLTSWLAKKSQEARTQRVGVSGIVSSEGIVQFESTPNVPQWLKSAIGEEYFREEKVIDLATNLGRKEGTGELKVTEETLKYLGTLTGVEQLELGNQREVTDDRLALLSPLKSLNTLYLHRTAIRGPGLVHLEQLPKLESLSLDGAAVDDSGAKHLGNMSGLAWLRLENTKITDAGLANLGRLSSLKTLSLGNTDVTDAGLPHLEQLRQLKELGLHGTNVTREGVARLQQALPQCLIITTFGLGIEPEDLSLFTAGYQPTADEINARLKELHIDGEVQTDPARPGAPIVQLRLFSCTLSDRAVLSLVEHMPELEVLNLRNALVGDDLLEGLGPLPIRYLSLDGTRVTNDGLVHLSKFSKLEQLLLNRTGVTDDGLSHLERLAQLRLVLLDGTRTTQDRIERLKQKLPSFR